MKKHLWPLYIAEFFRSLSFFVPIWILFFQSRGLDLADVGFVATGIYLASVILEYPSGIFADKFGRKTSVMVAIIMSCIALVLEVTAYSTIQFFIGALFIGASFAFTSGAKEALIYDTLKDLKLQRYNSKVLGILDTIGAVGAILSSLLGSFLYDIQGTLPYFLTITAYIIALIFITFLREPKYKKDGEIIDTLKNFKDGLKIVWNNPVLKSLLLLYIPLFFFEEAWHNAKQPILLGLGMPLVLLGAYHATQQIISGIGGMTLPKLLDKFNHKTLLLGIILFEAFIWFVLWSNSLIPVIIFSYMLMIIHQLWNYVDADIIHNHISSHVRATTLSARQMLISLIWVFNPWLMGALVDTFDRNILFPVFGGLVLFVGLFVFLWRKNNL